MGKSTKYPSFTNGAVSVNGNRLADVSKSGNTVTSSYNMPEMEKNIYDYAQNSLLASLPQIDVFSADVQNNVNSQLEAYKNQGMQTLNSLYTPIINNLKNDMASRFGNMNNSMFIDKLNAIENNRTKAINDLVQNILTQRENLYNNELSRRYNYLNLMNSLQNQINNNILNYLGVAQSNSSLGNSYNQNAYNANTAAANSNANQNAQYAQMMMTMLPLLI